MQQINKGFFGLEKSYLEVDNIYQFPSCRVIGTGSTHLLCKHILYKLQWFAACMNGVSAAKKFQTIDFQWHVCDNVTLR